MLAIALGLVIAEPRARAEQAALPVDVQVDLLSKVLPYDKSYAGRIANGLTIGVVFVPQDDVSLLAKDSVVTQLEKYARIARYPVKVEEIPEDLLSKTDGVDVLWLCAGVSVAVALVEMKRAGALGVTADEAAVEAGVPLGLLVRGQRPRVAVNRASAERLGVVFDARLLGLAEIIEGPAAPPP